MAGRTLPVATRAVATMMASVAMIVGWPAVAVAGPTTLLPARFVSTSISVPSAPIESPEEGQTKEL